MNLTFWRWFVGLILALPIALFAIRYTLRLVRLYLAGKPTLDDEPGIAGWQIGLLERFFFVFIIAFNVSGGAIAMIAWITVKMVTNWGPMNIEQSKNWLPFPQTSLLGNILSMLFALVGGLICRGTPG